MNLIFSNVIEVYTSIFWVACKLNEPLMLTFLATNQAYSSINIKNKLIAYMYIRSTENLDEKSYMSA